MARHRRMLAPINTNKHYIAQTETVIAAGANLNLVIADGVSAPANANTFDVTEGSTVKAVRCEMWLASGGISNALDQKVIVVEKVPAGAPAITFAQMLNLQAYDNKKNILFVFQGILSANINGTNPIAPIREWLLIPKGKQRFGLGDRLVMSIGTVGENVTICGFFTYKEYR